MNNTVEIQLRLADETLHALPSSVRKNHGQIAACLTTALGNISLGFPLIYLLPAMRLFASLADRLESLRLRLRVAVPPNPADADIAIIISRSHHEARLCLARMSAALKTVETMTPFLFGGSAPLEFTEKHCEASLAAHAALDTDPAGLTFRLGLLLVVTDAVTPPSNEQIGEMLQAAQGQGLLPADRMIGLPDYSAKTVKKNFAEKAKKPRLQLETEARNKLKEIATALGWTETEFANRLLQAHAANPQSVQSIVEFQARGELIRALVDGIQTLRGFIDEAALRRYECGTAPDHDARLTVFGKYAGSLEARAYVLLHMIAGSSWVFSEDFLRALDPLLTAVQQGIPPEAEITVELKPMVDYLRLLKILPPAMAATTIPSL